ncbi:MAG TPA: sugar O-acetyltransferase [Bacillota bacterium]|jgi:maltose O-acetyltransferase|nr:sugar O-acetyltransferase [Bacillota bacterium]
MNGELEKMLSGELYDAGDPELYRMRLRARRLTREFNATTEEEHDLRVTILKELFASVGSAFIEPPFYCDYGSNICVGKNFYMNFNCVILDCAAVEIGDNVMAGPGVHIYTAYHPLDAAVRVQGLELAAPVKIGNNVWIGGGAIICPGVVIGDNTTIGAGSVVTRDVLANVFAAGNPCRVMRDLE